MVEAGVLVGAVASEVAFATGAALDAHRGTAVGHYRIEVDRIS